MKIYFLASLLFAVEWISGAEYLQKVEQFLEDNRIYRGTDAAPGNYDVLHREITAKKDPGSKFGYIVFSVARHGKKLLTTDQAASLEELIETRRTNPINWHDLRNIVRVHAVIEMWKGAAAVDEGEAKSYRERWERWTDLRLAYMFQEFVEKERFQRAAWNILTKEQKEKLLSGEWDQYLKKSTGHGRLYSAPKQVTRVLGKPDHPEAFEAASMKWEEKWKPMLEKYLAASTFQQKREFSMDLAGEDFAVASWQEYAQEFRRFVTMEHDAIRDLVQVGYTPEDGVDKKITGQQEKLRDEMVEKYSAKAAPFLELLGVNGKAEILTR